MSDDFTKASVYRANHQRDNWHCHESKAGAKMNAHDEQFRQTARIKVVIPTAGVYRSVIENHKGGGSAARCPN